MIQVIEESTFLKLDNAAIVDFLTTSASVLLEHQKIEQKEIDNLRLVLSGITSSPSRSHPILLAMEQQKAEFLRLLSVRFGLARLGQNLISYCVRPRLLEWQVVLAQFGGELLKKSDLYFNRVLKLYFAGQYAEDRLAPSYILAVCQNFRLLSEDFARHVAGFSIFQSCGLAAIDEGDDHAIDRSMALGLGFHEVDTEIPLRLRPLNELTALARTIESTINLVGAFQAQLSLNHLKLSHSQTQAYHHELVIEGKKLRAIIENFADQSSKTFETSLTEQEVYRKQILITLDTLYSGLKDWFEMILSSLRSIPAGNDTKNRDGLPEASYRRLIWDLMVSGTASTTAQAAVDALVDYQQAHQIAFREILPGEMSRIHPALKESTHELLKLFGSQDTYTSTAAVIREKAKIVTTGKELQNFFQRALSFHSLFVVLGLWPLTLAALGWVLPGCGLKASPISEIGALRPDIPFKTPPKKPSMGTYQKALPGNKTIKSKEFLQRSPQPVPNSVKIAK